jgi:integrase/recombinase XerD
MVKRLNRASVSISDARFLSTTLKNCFDDFMLSRKAMMVAKRTLGFYENTAGQFASWLVAHGKTSPQEIDPGDVRSYLNEFVEAGAKPSYVHSHARAIKTFLIFMHEEGYIKKMVKFKMPPTGSLQDLPYLTPEEVKKALSYCNIRDRAIVMFLIDSGLRCAELISLNWEDVDIGTGIVHVQNGKGNKSRKVIIGARCRRALLAYRRDVIPNEQDPLFQTIRGGRFTVIGLYRVMARLSERSGIRVNPHALRRTFATLALKAGMNPLHLQGLLGHTTLEMTRRYIRMVAADLAEAHREYGPIDNFIK